MLPQIWPLSVIQILLSIFLLFAVSRVWLGFKNRTISLPGFLFWLIVWILAVIGILEPSFTTYIANLVGIGRGADVVVYTSIVLLFYLIFRTQVMLEDIRHEITKLVREIALRDAENAKEQMKK